MSEPSLSETAPAKINLALHVRERMQDGYHRIETLFAFAEDGDRLSVVPAPELTLNITGPFATGLSTGSDNLVLRAAQALQQASGITLGAAIELEKNLPIASGIGGGSADAAAALRLLARVWQTGVSLEPIAEQLGADVPACVIGETVRGEGRGERLTRVIDNRSAGLPLLLINPLVPVPTGPVFAAWDGIDRGPLPDGEPLAAALAGRNDLQAPAESLVPVIGSLARWLQARQGVVLARMSGSGATCFALFEHEAALQRAAAEAARDWPGFWTLATRLR